MSFPIDVVVANNISLHNLLHSKGSIEGAASYQLTVNLRADTQRIGAGNVRHRATTGVAKSNIIQAFDASANQPTKPLLVSSMSNQFSGVDLHFQLLKSHLQHHASRAEWRPNPQPPGLLAGPHRDICVQCVGSRVSNWRSRHFVSGTVLCVYPIFKFVATTKLLTTTLCSLSFGLRF